MPNLVDSVYYQVVPRNSFNERLLIFARDQIYADFIKEMHPNSSDRILDVGVSDVINDGANALERKYPYKKNITACGLGDAAEFCHAFPEVRYIKIAENERLPFEDKSFEIAAANAVLEHVGSKSSQEFFISELSRVADRVFISVPNKYFPIEHHTCLPFVHYSKLAFYVACKFTNKMAWTKEENLTLISYRHLQTLVPFGRRGNIGWTGIRLGPFSSNIFMSIGPSD